MFGNKKSVHPYPQCDCQGYCIQGFEDYMLRGKEVLTLLNEKNAIFIEGINSHEGFYHGTSNFKLDSKYENWKFIRSFDEIVQHDIFNRLNSEFRVSLNLIAIDSSNFQKYKKYPRFYNFSEIMKSHELRYT